MYLLTTIDKSIACLSLLDTTEKKIYIKGIEEEFSSLFSLLETKECPQILYVSITGLFLEMLANEDFQNDFIEYVNEEFCQENNRKWYKEGWGNTPIEALKKEVKKNRIHIVASSYSSFPMPLVQTQAGMKIQILKTLLLAESHFDMKPKGFYFPKGCYSPGLDKLLKEEGIVYSFINQQAYNLRDPQHHHQCEFVYSPHGIMMLPYLTNSICDTEIPSQHINFSAFVVEISELAVLNVRDKIGKNHPLFSFKTSIEEQVEENKNTVYTSHFPLTYDSMYNGKDIFSSKSEEFLIKAYQHELKLENMIFNSKNESLSSRVEELAKSWSIYIDAKDYLEQHHKNEFLYLMNELLGNQNSLLSKNERNMLNPLSKTSKNFIHKVENQLKIIMLSWEFPPNIVGGLARHVHGLGKAIADNGHEVHVITAAGDSLPLYEKMDGIHVHRVKPLYPQEEDFLNWIAGLNFSISDKIYELTKQIVPDVVHAHDWLVAASAISAKEVLNIPLIATIHSTEHGRNNGIYSEIQKRIHLQENELIKNADKIIVCSEYMKQELMDIFSCTDERLFILPNGIHSESMVALPETNITRFLPNQEFPIVFSWGRIVQEKGFETLIKTASILKKRGIKVRFIIAGKGPFYPYLTNKIREKNLGDYIHFIGYVTDEERNSILKKARITVFPSTYEPFGIVALEAMAAGKLVIVSETGGLKSIIQNQINGLLMKPGDSESLASLIEMALDNPEVADRLSKAGKKVAHSLFNWNRIGMETLRVFKEMLIEERIKRSETNGKLDTLQETRK